ncbi:MAG TPA: ABC transporter ATP-binding protein [Ramlibacter sp.]|nr:ABC transporter ATP-binding protein [Ramlibacter sp.]
MLNVENIEVVYNHVILVLRGVSLEVPEGGIVALLGGNGAGKTTTLRAISSLLAGERGKVTGGGIWLRGARIENSRASALVRRGLVQVMEGRHCFGHLTIEENLLAGAWTRSDAAAAVAQSLQKVYTYFPRLKTRRDARAATTSGGEQQMCAIGRALMANPRLVLLDEPSMGLAPQLVAEVFGIVRELNRQEGVSFLIAEQNSHMALEHARFAYVLESGRVVLQGSAAELAGNASVQESYLGTSGGVRKSFREAARVPAMGLQSHGA